MPLAGDAGGVLRRLELQRYSLVRELHRGGQGVVYLAEQLSPHRQVAVKMVREGPLASIGERVRFQREIEMLGSLSHPNIVSIHDSGGEDGYLYYVMDFVDGPSLADHVRPRREAAAASGSRKTLEQFHRETLLLFTKVCDAVQAAHLRGIIHRDLKPSNIRVDPRGEPRVLDFGLAKAASTENRPGGDQTLTEAGQFLGTLAYASPEQAEGAADALDLRTDIYSLGVILYELLTGRSPYVETDRVGPLLHAIQHDDPIRPSTIVRELRGDLETILLTSLQKPRERRYQTAGALAADIHRYLADEAIDARRDSTWYVVRKQLKKHRVPAVAAALILVLIVVGLVVSLTLWRTGDQQRQLAEREARKSMAINDFLHEMLASADPFRRPGQPTEVREILDHAEERLSEGAFRDDPEIQAGLRNTLGMSYLALGRTQDAIEQLNAALTQRATALQADDPSLADDHFNLGRAYFNAGEYDSSARHLETALAMLTSRGAEGGLKAIETEYLIGSIELHLGKPQEAEVRLERLLERLGEDGEPRLRILILDGLSMIEGQRRDAGKAVEFARQSIALQRATTGEHPDLINPLTRLGNALVNDGKYHEAAEVYRESTGLARKFLGRHPTLADCLSSELINLTRLGAYEEAYEAGVECVSILREYHGEEHIRTVTMLSNTAHALRKLGRLEEAAEIHRECIAIARQVGRRISLAGGLAQYGQVLHELRQFDAAEASLRESVEIFRQIKMNGRPIPSLAATLINLASVLMEAERPSDAEPVIRESLQLLNGNQKSSGAEYAAAKMLLGRCLVAREEWSEAERLFLEGVDDLESIETAPALREEFRRSLRHSLVELYRRWHAASPDAGHDVQMAHWQEQLAALEVAESGENP